MGKMYIIELMKYSSSKVTSLQSLWLQSRKKCLTLALLQISSMYCQLCFPFITLFCMATMDSGECTELWWSKAYIQEKDFQYISFKGHLRQIIVLQSCHIVYRDTGLKYKSGFYSVKPFCIFSSPSVLQCTGIHQTQLLIPQSGHSVVIFVRI